MASPPEDLQGNLPPLRPPSGRPIRLSVQCPADSLLLPVSIQGSGADRCVTKSMAKGSPVRLPPPTSPPGGNTQASPRTSRGNPSGPILAKETLVRRLEEPLLHESLADSSGEDLTQSGGDFPPGATMATTSRLALERSILTRGLCSQGVIRVIQASRRPSTNRIYEATWKSFQTWCFERNLTLRDLTVPNILEFLLSGLERGLAPNTLRRQIAALSTILSDSAGEPLGKHTLLRSFLKGAANIRPPTVHRYPSWELPRVLRALTRAPFEPLRTCDIRYLTHKVAFLVAITSARRISELASLSTREDLCCFHRNRVVLRLDPSFIPKVNSLFHRTQEIVLPDFCPNPTHDLERQWHTLDVRRALRHYISRTAEFRRSEALFISFHSPSRGRKVSSSTIGRWIRACIAGAYQAETLPVPKHITAHSTRSAATSAAWDTQAPIEEVCRAATWASPSPFIRHYKIDKYSSAEASFGRRVLQQVLNQSHTQDQSIPHPEGQ